MTEPTQKSFSTSIADELLERWQQAMDAKDRAISYANQFSDDVETCLTSDDVSCSDVAAYYYDAAEETVMAAIHSDDGQKLIHLSKKYGPAALTLVQGNIVGTAQNLLVSEAVDRAPQVTDVVVGTVVPKAKEVASSALETGKDVVEEYCLVCPEVLATIKNAAGDVVNDVIDGEFSRAYGRAVEGAKAVYRLASEDQEEPAPQTIQEEILIAEAETEPFSLCDEDEVSVSVHEEKSTTAQEAVYEPVAVQKTEEGPVVVEEAANVDVVVAVTKSTDEPSTGDAADAETVLVEECGEAEPVGSSDVCTEEEAADGADAEAVVYAAVADTNLDEEDVGAKATDQDGVVRGGVGVDEVDALSTRVSTGSFAAGVSEQVESRDLSGVEGVQARGSVDSEALLRGDAGITTARVSARLTAQRELAAQRAVQHVGNDRGQELIDGASAVFLQTLPSAFVGLSYVQQLVEQRKERDRRRVSEFPQVLFVFVHSGMLLGRQMAGYSSLEDGVLVDLEQQERTHHLQTVASNTAASGQGDHSSSDATGIALDALAAAIEGEISVEDSSASPPVVILRKISPADTVVC